MSKKIKTRKLDRCDSDFHQTKEEIGASFFKSVAKIIVNEYKQTELSELRERNSILVDDIKTLRKENLRLIESLYSTKNLKLVENFLSYLCELCEDYSLVECKGEPMCGEVAIIDSKENVIVATASDLNEYFVKCETCDSWVCSNHSQKCYCGRSAFCQSDDCSPENCQHEDCDALLCGYCNVECSLCSYNFCKEHLNNDLNRPLCNDCLSEHSEQDDKE